MVNDDGIALGGTLQLLLVGSCESDSDVGWLRILQQAGTRDHVVGHSRVDDEAASVSCCHLESCQSEKDTSAVGVPC
jgi:hypothetical protein